MLRIFILILILALSGCTAKVEQAPQTRLEAVKQLCHAVGNHDYLRAWTLMPEDWRQELTKAINKNTSLLPKPMLDRLSQSTLLLADVSSQKSKLLAEFILGLGEDEGVSKEKIHQSFHSFSRILKIIADEIANIKEFDEKDFFTETVTPIMRELEGNYAANLEFEEENGYKLQQFFAELRNAEFKELEDGRIEFKICGELYQLSVKEINGVFVPEPLQEFHDETLESLKGFNAELKDIKVQQILPYAVAGFLEGVAVSIRNAEKPQDIETAFNFFPFGLGFGGDSVDHSAIDREKKYQEAQAYILGQELAKAYKGKAGKCLVIHQPVSKGNNSDFTRIVEAMKKGLGNKVTEMRMKPIKEFSNKNDLEMEEAMMELTANDFNKVLRANKDCDIVVTMASLPFSEEELFAIDLYSMIEDSNDPGMFIKNPKIKYPVFGIYNGYVGNLEGFFLDRLIHAMTLWKPDPIIDEEPVPDNQQEAFNKRYLTLTPDNLELIKKKYKQLFPKPRTN